MDNIYTFTHSFPVYPHSDAKYIDWSFQEGEKEIRKRASKLTSEIEYDWIGEKGRAEITLFATGIPAE